MSKLKIVRSYGFVFVLFILFFATSLASVYKYIYESGTVMDLQSYVESKPNDALETIFSTTGQEERLLTEASHIFLMKHVMFYSKGGNVTFIGSMNPYHIVEDNDRLNLYKKVSLRYKQLDFSFVWPLGLSEEVLNNTTFLLPPTKISPLNASRYSKAEPFRLDDNPSNYLINIHTPNSIHYSSSPMGGQDRKNIAFFSLENEPIGNSKFSGAGKYMVLVPVGFKRGSRFVFNLSSSNIQNEMVKGALPSIKIVGEKTYFINPVGRGSMRMVSEQVAPAYIDKIPYFIIDLGEKQVSMSKKEGLVASLYASDINNDPRFLTTFVRDISLAEASSPFDMPNAREFVPTAQNLQGNEWVYSGIYEDGWTSDEFMVSLRGSKDCMILRLEGDVPDSLLGGASIYDNGTLVYRVNHINELKSLTVNIKNTYLTHNIYIKSDIVNYISMNDRRPTIMRLKSLSLSCNTDATH